MLESRASNLKVLDLSLTHAIKTLVDGLYIALACSHLGFNRGGGGVKLGICTQELAIS